MFERFEGLIEKEQFKQIQDTKVMIIGVGGVGGITVTSLVRSGIKNIIIVDYDIVDITNINRQVIAYHSTINQKKVDVLKKIILDINPECSVQTIDIKVTPDNLKQLLEEYSPNYVVDACDDVKVKQAIIKECLLKKIKFISSMGTGNKFDPTKLEMVDIRKTNNDPLARIMRKWVKDNHITEKIMVVSSEETPKKVAGKVLSTSFVPTSAGLLITSYIINNIIKIDA